MIKILGSTFPYPLRLVGTISDFVLTPLANFVYAGIILRQKGEITLFSPGGFGASTSFHQKKVYVCFLRRAVIFCITDTAFLLLPEAF
jgi:hypothetical protein